jgi:hypothetical protein
MNEDKSILDRDKSFFDANSPNLNSLTFMDIQIFLE